MQYQNANNSVRVTDEFMQAVKEDRDWDLKAVKDGRTIRTMKARDLWRQIATASWECADPGLQFDTTINKWHTAHAAGRINGSNPCSEYMFLDNTACNLASLNLRKFFDTDNNTFKVADFEYATRMWTVVLEISVLMAQFPSKEVAQLSYDYRTLGLGYANLGSMLMVAGIPYDSNEALALCGSITAILTGLS